MSLRTSTLRTAVAAGAAAASLLVGLPADAQTPEGTLTVSPTSAAVGSPITVSGDNCFDGLAWIFMVRPDTEETVVLSGDGSVTAGADGVWSASFAVPDVDTDAEWYVSARCWIGELDFVYGVFPLDVLAGDEPPPVDPADPVDPGDPSSPESPVSPSVTSGSPAVAPAAQAATPVVARPTYAG